MRRLALIAAALTGFAAPSIAHAESFGGGVGFYPNGRVAGINLNYSTGNRGGYGYGGNYGGYGGGGYGNYGRGVPIQYVQPVIIQQPVVTRQIIAVCDRGGVLGAESMCHVTRRIR